MVAKGDIIIVTRQSLNLKHGRNDSGSQKHRQFCSVTLNYERI